MFLYTAVVPDPEASSDSLTSWGSSLSVFSRLSFPVTPSESEVGGCSSSSDEVESEVGGCLSSSDDVESEVGDYSSADGVESDSGVSDATSAHSGPDVVCDDCSEDVPADAAAADVPVRGVKRKMDEVVDYACSKRQRLTEDSWIPVVDDLADLLLQFRKLRLC